MTTTLLLEDKLKEKEKIKMTLIFLLEDTWRKFKRTNILRNILFVSIIIVSFFVISEIENLTRVNEVEKGNLTINTKFENNLKSDDEETIKKEEVKTEIKTKEIKTTNEKVYTLININTATSQMLQSLNGIGESYANKIIEYRSANGPFKTIEEIKNIKGIGDAKFNKIKKYIEV